MSLFCKEKIVKRGKKGHRAHESNPASQMVCTYFFMKIASQKTRKKNFAQEIAEFEATISDAAGEVETQTLKQIFMKEQTYSKIENYNNYLNSKQKQISWFRRAIVVNWMMEICQGFSCKYYTDKILFYSDRVFLGGN